MELMARNEQLVQLPCLALKQEEEEEEEDVEEPGLPQLMRSRFSEEHTLGRT